MKVLKSSIEGNFERAKRDFISEAQILSKLSHNNIVKIYDFKQNVTLTNLSGESELDKTYIVLEYITGGELFFQISDHGRFDESLARYYFHQLIDSLDHLHQ